MIRFRLGQSWKREHAASPEDSFGLHLDGVDVISAAKEEPLATVVPDLIDAVSRLYQEGAELAQLSLPEAHLEVALQRKGANVQISVVNLGRPSRLVHPQVSVDLQELSAAAAQCARALLRDLVDAAPSLAKALKLRRMARQLSEMERAPMAADKRLCARTGFSHRSEALAHAFGFELSDGDDLLLCLPRDGSAGLASLLFEGSLFLRLDGDQPAWRANGLPFLLTLELSRQAHDLSHSVEIGEQEFSLEPAGPQSRLRFNLRNHTVQVAGREYAARGLRIAQAIFDLGLALSFAVTARNKAQRKNAYLAELVDRCREGLTHIAGRGQPALDKRWAQRTRHRSATARPLKVPGRLRRLRFTKLWDKHRLGGNEPGRILLSKSGPIFCSGEMACAFAPDGTLRYRRVATHGIAASADDFVVAAFADRMLMFVGGEESARWRRDHDGLSIGPEVERRDGILICSSQARAAIALQELSGREAWRLAPPRAHRIFTTFQGHRALVATESGHLYGLDIPSGLIRYRFRSALPFTGPPVPWGRKVLASVGRSDRLALLAVDAHSGAVQWNRELHLARPARPLPQGHRILLAGERDQRGILICLGSTGKPIWERTLDLGSPPYSLLAVRRSTLVCGSTGAAVLVGGDGAVAWSVAPLENELLLPCLPASARGILLIPGEKVRAVDPRSGEVLGEVRAGIGLCDLKVDAKLNLFLLDEDGSMQAYRLASHFALVAGGDEG